MWRSAPPPQEIGWAIGRGEDYDNREYQDQVEAGALYDLLERDVIPTFYDRGSDRIPRKWISRMKASIGTLCRFVNTHRMVSDYTCRFYTKAHAQFRLLEAGSAARAKALAAWMTKVRAGWPQVRVESVEDGPGAALLVGTNLRAHARVQLGPLTPEDVAVELYLGKVDPSGEMQDAATTLMKPVGRDANGRYVFEATPIPCSKSGMHGFTVRVRPYHPDLPAADGTTAFLPGLITWA